MSSLRCRSSLLEATASHDPEPEGRHQSGGNSGYQTGAATGRVPPATDCLPAVHGKLPASAGAISRITTCVKDDLARQNQRHFTASTHRTPPILTLPPSSPAESHSTSPQLTSQKWSSKPRGSECTCSRCNLCNTRCSHTRCKFNIKSIPRRRRRSSSSSRNPSLPSLNIPHSNPNPNLNHSQKDQTSKWP